MQNIQYIVCYAISTKKIKKFVKKVAKSSN